MMRGLLALCVTLMLSWGAEMAEARYTILGFDQLEGWEGDEHRAALDVFLNTCTDMDDPDWDPVCILARRQSNARTFFEAFFRPVLVDDGNPGLFTGYFEPELLGARRPTQRFRYPLYRKPSTIPPGTAWYTRGEIEEQNLMDGRNLEIAWVESPVDVFFLQVQGSGRIKLTDGGMIRVGYGGNNGHPYRSVGAEMVRRGLLPAHKVSAQVIRNWVQQFPQEGARLLRHNPSFVFFREVNRVSADKGPLGAMNRSITPNRTVAIDPSYVPLGAPVWLEKNGKTPIRRLMVAQDTGSAIKGAQRADIFYGTGREAGRTAGRIKDPGRIVVLMPIQRAFALVPEG